MTPEAAARFLMHFFEEDSLSRTHRENYSRDCVFHGSILGLDKRDPDTSVLVIVAREKYATERDLLKLITKDYLQGKDVQVSVTMTDAEQPDTRHIYDVIALRGKNPEVLQKAQKEIGNFEQVARGVGSLVR